MDASTSAALAFLFCGIPRAVARVCAMEEVDSLIGRLGFVGERDRLTSLAVPAAPPTVMMEAETSVPAVFGASEDPPTS